VFGAVIPYTSPRRGGNHLHEEITRPVTGWNVRAMGSVKTLKLKVTFPAVVKKLNRIRNPEGSIYRREFLQLTGRAAGEGTKIAMGALELLRKFIMQEVK
jgi:hypothetical protein